MIPTEYFSRFETPKYRNENRLQRALIRHFVSTLHDLFIEALPAKTVLEVGVGEGFLSGYLSEKFPSLQFGGLDLSAQDISRLGQLFPGVQAQVGSIYDVTQFGPPRDIVLCCEVLEHVDDPERALQALAAMTKRYAILSVPHEPFFMLSNLLRGKNALRFGNDPEHINHWSAKGFKQFVSRAFVVESSRQAFPWTLLLARPR